ncbi:DUF302 domain-containing protein [Litoribacter ruber]|uniref:DUF302 domain-containing protein n=1 Tax=Litoribacter ruber TaxID=702568 RepID=UPI001BD933FB|nr:DUF302 domain-containing protein [Litoribacter ruber]MBT0810516.1 DUF302 domain-containing protein [Litoribacter ruber]
MKLFTGLFCALLLLSFPSLGQENLKSHQSQHNFDQTISLLKSKFSDRGIEVMQVIDHGQNAKNAGLELEKTQVLVFGNPKVGTKLMQSNADIAIELPLRLLVMERQGKVTVKYTDPTSWVAKYGLQTESEILANMAELLDELGRTVE